MKKYLNPKLLLFIFICIIFSAIFTIYHNNQNLYNNDDSGEVVATMEVKPGFVHERCQGDERRLCVPPFHVFEKRFRTASKYKINVCVIEKNLSTILTAILCYLHNEEKFIEAKRNINNEDFHHRFCRTNNEALDLNIMEKKFQIPLIEWTHLVAVRDPVERFISGFTDKCLLEKVWLKRRSLCNGCKTNVTCFIEKEYIRMMQYSNGVEMNTFDDRHFFPQTWRCQFYEYFRKYKILHYSSKETNNFMKQFYTILRSSNVTESSIEFIDQQMNEARTIHTTSGKNERRAIENEVKTSERIMTLLTRMYYYDFLLFGFSLPPIPTPSSFVDSKKMK